MQFSVARFNGLLSPNGGAGQPVIWCRSSKCPCRTPVSAGGDTDCFQCRGKGILYGDPQPAWAGTPSMRVAKDWSGYGQSETGDLMLSVPADSPLYEAGVDDKVILINSSEPFSYILTRSPTLYLWFPVVELQRCYWLSPDTTVLFEGALPIVALDGTLSWADGTAAPPMGTQFSLTGRSNPAFRVFRDLPQDRALFGTGLPRRMSLKRLDLADR